MTQRALFAWIWTALLITLFLIPKSKMHSEDPDDLPHLIPHIDKVAHAGLFAVFSVAWMRAVRSPRRMRWILATGVLLAVLTEIAQGLPIVARDPSLLDSLADIVGVLIGLGAYRYATSGIAAPDVKSVAT